MVLRLEAGERIAAVSDELKIRRKLLYEWRAAHRKLGVAGLNRKRGRKPGGDAIYAVIEEIRRRKAPPTARRATGGAAAPNQRLTQLHVAQANALFAARGYGAPETTEAFARARELALGDKDAPERLAADYGLWVGSYSRGDLPSMRAQAAVFLNDLEAKPDSPEAGIAHRAAGITCWVAGEYREARDHLERALALFQPGRDNDLAFRFGLDPGVAAMFSLAVALWPLGEVDRAVSLVEQMLTRIADLTHVGTLAVGRMYATLFELMRGDRTRAAPNAFELARLAREPGGHCVGLVLNGGGTGAAMTGSGRCGTGMGKTISSPPLLKGYTRASFTLRMQSLS